MKERSQNPAVPVVRPADLDDVQAIFDLIREHADNLITRSFNDIVQNIDRFYVAEAEGAIVGCAGWSLLPEIGEVTHTAVEIKSVAVRRAWRGRRSRNWPTSTTPAPKKSACASTGRATPR